MLVMVGQNLGRKLVTKAKNVMKINQMKGNFYFFRQNFSNKQSFKKKIILWILITIYFLKKNHLRIFPWIKKRNSCLIDLNKFHLSSRKFLASENLAPVLFSRLLIAFTDISTQFHAVFFWSQEVSCGDKMKKTLMTSTRAHASRDNDKESHRNGT